jgi:hypothetical protein
VKRHATFASSLAALQRISREGRRPGSFRYWLFWRGFTASWGNDAWSDDGSEPWSVAGIGVKPPERRFISVRQQRTIQLLVERGSVSLDTVHQALGMGSVRVEQFIVQQSQDGAGLDDVQIALSRGSERVLVDLHAARSQMSTRAIRRETVMTRSYDYEGFTLEISVESDVCIGPNRREPKRSRYVAVVRIFHKADTVAVFSPLRFGEARGRPFASEADALMGGYSAACKIVDDLFCHDRH